MLNQPWNMRKHAACACAIVEIALYIDPRRALPGIEVFELSSEDGRIRVSNAIAFRLPPLDRSQRRHARLERSLHLQVVGSAVYQPYETGWLVSMAAEGSLECQNDSRKRWASSMFG